MKTQIVNVFPNTRLGHRFLAPAIFVRPPRRLDLVDFGFDHRERMEFMGLVPGAFLHEVEKIEDQAEEIRDHHTEADRTARLESTYSRIELSDHVARSHYAVAQYSHYGPKDERVVLGGDSSLNTCASRNDIGHQEWGMHAPTALATRVCVGRCQM